MRGEMREVLERWLGADARVVDALSDEELGELHAALVAARKRQAAALAAASAEALRQMPAPLRARFGEIVGF
ncbi:MAG TPA: hypothetical protein VGR06_07805 [Actinophytocola sp.]|uniref:hypothetical protein n=1 Tax=Actinophytocola sp. TaxID=1872138 RepID=UPI002DFFB268|nr:hypothetical protein [Actinophytocola sp.]